MSNWTAASSDCGRDDVHIRTADLYRPNARFTPERQRYQVLTPFGKLGYSHMLDEVDLAANIGRIDNHRLRIDRQSFLRQLALRDLLQDAFDRNHRARADHHMRLSVASCAARQMVKRKQLRLFVDLVPRVRPPTRNNTS